MIMALFQLHFHSQALRRHTYSKLYIPDRLMDAEASGHKCPVLCVLHDCGDSSSKILCNTLITRYADQGGIILVLPDGEDSAFENMQYWDQFADYVYKELPVYMNNVFQMCEEAVNWKYVGIGDSAASVVKRKVPLQGCGICSKHNDWVSVDEELKKIFRQYKL